MKIEDLQTATGLISSLRETDDNIRRAHAAHALTLNVFTDTESLLGSGCQTVPAPANSKLECDLRNAWLAELRRKRSDTEIALIRLGIEDIPAAPELPETEGAL